MDPPSAVAAFKMTPVASFQMREYNASTGEFCVPAIQMVLGTRDLLCRICRNEPLVFLLYLIPRVCSVTWRALSADWRTEVVLRGVWARLQELSVPDDTLGVLYDKFYKHNAAITGGLVHQVLLSTFDNPMAVRWHINEKPGEVDLDVLTEAPPVDPNWIRDFKCSCPLPHRMGVECTGRSRWCDRCRVRVQTTISKDLLVPSLDLAGGLAPSPLEADLCPIFLDGCAMPNNGHYFCAEGPGGVVTKVWTRKRLLPRNYAPVHGESENQALPLARVSVDFLLGFENSGRIVPRSRLANRFHLEATRFYCRMGRSPALCISKPMEIYSMVALVDNSNGKPHSGGFMARKYRDRGYAIASREEIAAVPDYVAEYLMLASRSGFVDPQELRPASEKRRRTEERGAVLTRVRAAMAPRARLDQALVQVPNDDRLVARRSKRAMDDPDMM